MDKKTPLPRSTPTITQDQLQAQTDKQLFDLGVISGLAYNKSKNTADQLTTQHQLSHATARRERKGHRGPARFVPRSKIDQAKTLLDLYEKQTAALEVKAGIAGQVAASASVRCRWARMSPPEHLWPK